MGLVLTFSPSRISDVLERDRLSQAQNNLTQCLNTVEEARRAQPAIQQLSEVSIDQGHMVSDVLFDSMFADFQQHDRIKSSQAQMQAAANHLDTIGQEQAQRVVDANAALTQATGQLNEARQELQRIRAEAFEQFAADKATGPPPAYQA